MVPDPFSSSEDGETHAKLIPVVVFDDLQSRRILKPGVDSGRALVGRPRPGQPKQTEAEEMIVDREKIQPRVADRCA